MTGEQIRPARADDVAELAALHVASWKAAYRGLVPDDYLDGLAPEDRIATWQRRIDDPLASTTFTLVSADDSKISGFGVGTVDAPGDARGTVEALYVAPNLWRHGVGRGLLAAVEDGLAARGCSNATLWVLDGNARAIAFYEARGWANEGAARWVTLFGIEVLEHRFGRPLR